MKDVAKQVADQCRVIAHAARVIADIHADKAEIVGRASPSMVEFMGRETAQLMELLGDILNGMDAVLDEDAWVNPIFAEAQRRWPAGSAEGVAPQVEGESPREDQDV